MQVQLLKKVLRGQRSRSYVHECVWCYGGGGIHFDYEGRLTCFSSVYSPTDDGVNYSIKTNNSITKTRLPFNRRQSNREHIGDNHLSCRHQLICTTKKNSSCDLDLDPIPITLIWRCTGTPKNKLFRRRFRALQTDRQTDICDKRHYHHVAFASGI